ncbi:putative flavin-containing monoamine oxidase A [Channa argus]|uniref:Amine oxidase n=1 Tax=Channa argus TaxID=215402 RepID=A0A6G1QIH9_CHAAH|nr:putative flavin-containing monoamine oxidase A [Channa argus]
MTADIWDVIIVGAGLSGLSAAYLFKKRNPKLRILVLEGKDRVGGRTVTSEIPAANGVDHWDFGGQWVGSTQIHLLELIKELGLETYPQFNTGKKVHHMGRPDAKVRTYRTSIPALSPWVLMDLTQILWKGGTQQLSECLAERVGWKNVRLGSAVTAIWQDAEWARVTTNTDTLLCRAVIVTCPPHLAAKIHYEPALPSQREFLTQNMPVGHMIKFIITYQTAFWKENGFSGEIVAGSSTNCPFSVTFDATSPSGNAALVGFIAGKHASQWSSKEAGVRREAVISSLVNYLGPEAASFIHYQEKDWANEDYSGGCPVNVMAPDNMQVCYSVGYSEMQQV